MTGIDFRKHPILYVDDDDNTSLFFHDYFGKEFTILTASSGEAALDLMDRHPEIVILITDQKMPGMRGIQLLQQAGERRPDLIKILVTGFSEMNVLIEAINLGQIFQFVEKPFIPIQLQEILKRGIERFLMNRDMAILNEEKLKSLKKMAKANRLEAVGILAAGMAHEINNPLVAIQTFLNMAPVKRREDDPDFWDKFYQVACKDVARIRQIISQLLAYAKNKEESKLALADTDLNLLISETAALLEQEAQKKNLSISLALSHDLGSIFVDPEKFKQVIINLILNAIDATTKGGIDIETSKPDDHFVQITISDTGKGIPEEHLQKLFIPFFTTKEEGTGLGLMTSHHIIDQHRGTIEVESTVSKGSTFTIQMPVDPSKYDRRSRSR
jgi:signal transduction histidine kinase